MHVSIKSAFILFTMIIGLLSGQANSQSTNIDEAQIKQVVSGHLDALGLEGDTREQVQQVLLEAGEKRRQIMEDIDGEVSELSFRDKIKLKKTMDGIQADTKQKLAALLTDEQLEQWEEIRQAQMSKMRNQRNG